MDVDPSTPEIDPIPAADADGDGIADALLWKLPVGPMNGVTYYAAVRVVDNNSAINVNTALARNFDFDGGLEAMQSPYAPSYFLGRVGLAEILRSYKPKGKSVFALGDEFRRAEHVPQQRPPRHALRRRRSRPHQSIPLPI